MADFTHFNDEGRAWMVDVGGKDVTSRKAVAAGRVLVNEETFRLIKDGGMKKGDVMGTAQIAGIMAAKKTSGIIPMCHPLPLTSIDIKFNMNEEPEVSGRAEEEGNVKAVEIQAEVACRGVTGVEMEALTAVSAAALTVYDMCKAVQKDMIIDSVRLLEKSGGKSGDFRRNEK